MDSERMNKLVKVAKMYYEDNMNQSEIAKAIGVSRPLISFLLSDAKQLGIVEIKINSPFEIDNSNMKILCKTYNIQGGSLINGVNSKGITERMIVKSSYEFIKETTNNGDCIGISWGNMIGDLVQFMEVQDKKLKLNGTVCSLIGNSATANKNYHTDELCRAFGQASGCKPHFALAPAFYETKEDLISVSDLDFFSKIQQSWEKVNFAIVDVENHPSVPDLATASRFGSKRKDAVGHMASYYYDKEGKMIENENDIVYRIPLEQLKKSDVVMGICSCNVTVENLIGALKTGILTHIFVDQEIAQEVVLRLTNSKI
ncbi:MAG: sugar-binding domain-containing protein [Eubacteriales bacterium]